MLICILGHMNGTNIITKYFNMIIIQIIVKESMFQLKDLCTTSPDGNILASAVEKATKFYFLEDHETRQLPKN